MKIDIGKYQEHGVCAIDIEKLLKTRLLITANSGGGKSYLIRRFVEQAFGKIPILLIDPEGEFPSLREKFDFVLVGKGGETPAEIRSASLVAQKLLELRASAVVDLYELKPQTRHEYVRLFLDAVMNAPKHLWRPTLIVVDESHKFCPEKGSGESVASESMIYLATAGRKRGFAAVWATQRLSKLRKDASAEFLNRLVGQTFEDVDLDRVVDLLGIGREDKRNFLASMRVLTPGRFWALGRAITIERKLVIVGDIQTTHQDVTSGKMIVEAPPPTEKIKALLPKLADLPKQAEEKAKTESDLRTEIRSLKAQLRNHKNGDIPPEKLAELVESRVAVAIRKDRDGVARYIATLKKHVKQRAAEAIASIANDWPEIEPAAPIQERIKPIAAKPTTLSPRHTAKFDTVAPERKLSATARLIASFVFSNPDKRWSKAQVAMMIGRSLRSSGFTNAISELVVPGFIRRDGVFLSVGEQMPEGIDTGVEFSIANVKRILGKCESELWAVLESNPDTMFTKDEWCDNTVSRYSPGSSGVGNAISSLNTLGLLSKHSGKFGMSEEAKELM